MYIIHNVFPSPSGGPQARRGKLTSAYDFSGLLPWPYSPILESCLSSMPSLLDVASHEMHAVASPTFVARWGGWPTSHICDDNPIRVLQSPLSSRPVS